MKLGDEVQHAIVANNTMKHFNRLTLFDDPYLAPVQNGSWRDWNKVHVWLNKPPFSFWLIAIFMFIFGPNEFGYRITAVLLGTCSLFITFLISKRLFGERTGYLAAFIQAICPITVLFDRGTWIDGGIFAIFSFWLELTVLCIIISYQEKKKIFYIFAGIFSGISYLSLSLIGFIPLLALLISLVLRKSKKLEWNREQLRLVFYVIFISFLVMLAWEINSLLQYGRIYLPVVLLHLNTSLAPAEPWYYHLERMFENLLGPLFIIFILGLITHFKRLRHSFSMSDLYILSLILPTLVVFSLAQSKFPHFLFPIYPYFYIVISNFLHNQTDLIRRKGISSFQILLVAITFAWVIIEIRERFFIAGYLTIPIAVILFSFLQTDTDKFPFYKIKQKKFDLLKMIVFYFYLIGACLFGPYWILSKEILGTPYALLVKPLAQVNEGVLFFGTNSFISMLALCPFLYILYNKHAIKSQMVFRRIKIFIVLTISLLFISGTLITLLGWTTRGWACLFNESFQYREVGYFIRENTDQQTVIYGLNEKDSYKIMFYSDRTALPGYPSSDRINELKLRGYDVLTISEPSQLPFKASLIYSERSSIFLYLL
jgi:4-amino-4-deoxy-L-arabinose transferase-like glycosyltransferase